MKGVALYFCDGLYNQSKIQHFLPTISVYSARKMVWQMKDVLNLVLQKLAALAAIIVLKVLYLVDAIFLYIFSSIVSIN